ncbi:hypothetical protein, partial [Microcoleus anatoxicus]
MVNKGNQKKGDRLLQIAVGVLASNWMVLPLKAQNTINHGRDTALPSPLYHSTINHGRDTALPSPLYHSTINHG